ncbi:hypothetical protein KI387_032932, partial [Taxus chinensis]
CSLRNSLSLCMLAESKAPSGMHYKTGDTVMRTQCEPRFNIWQKISHALLAHRLSDKERFTRAHEMNLWLGST